ncbi:MAG: recombinase family protein, partial [Ruminococcus sp.]|nr:recombinase family protein [Ruminococcus sp.]
IVPEEAEIVKMIYSDYLSGSGAQAIAKKLNDQHISTRFSKTWYPNMILKIIHNEKYAGNMLLQKTYRPDFRSKIDKKNRGEVRQYYVENSHDAIIDPKSFSDAQLISTQRRTNKINYRVTDKNEPKLFTGIMTCGLCGGSFRRKIANSTSYPNPIWICGRLFELGKKYCPSQQIPEKVLIEKTKDILGVIELNRNIILERIEEIEVTGHFHLRFTLKDGSVQYVVWKHKSRKESWTPEMKEKARQKALQRNAERRKNEQGHEDNRH